MGDLWHSNRLGIVQYKGQGDQVSITVNYMFPRKTSQSVSITDLKSQHPSWQL